MKGRLPPPDPNPAICVTPLTAPPLRLATILKSTALEGETVPAPVSTPKAGIVRLMFSARVPSGVTCTSALKFWMLVLFPPTLLPDYAEAAASCDPRLNPAGEELSRLLFAEVMSLL